MDWNAIYSGIGTAVAAIGSSVLWVEKRLVPIIKTANSEIKTNPHAKLAVADVEAALAAKDSSAREAEIKAAILQGLYVLKNPSTELNALERVWLQDFVSKAIPAHLQQFVNVTTIDNVLQSVPNLVTEAQNGEWFKAIQQVGQTVMRQKT